MPDVPRGPMYGVADPNMEFRVFQDGIVPGRVKLSVLRQLSQAVESLLDQRVAYLEAATTADERSIMTLQSSMQTEVQTRSSADTAMTQAMSSEAQTRASADAALQAQMTALKAEIVPLAGTMVLTAGLSILVGKSTRTINVTGLKKNENLVVTPNAALPANISMGEAYCLTDGILTVVLVNSAVLGLSITTALTIPLGIIALRPSV